jgi:RNA polymerase sigma factor for flagellar operon FliA
MMSPVVTAASDPESVFLANLALIDRLIAIAARRHALSAPDAEDFGAWARARLIDDDYAVLRKFGGRSSLATYLTTVLVNFFRDYRNSRWGRWRPSAEAKRRGPIGVRLEELLYRDGHPLREAVQILRSLGAPMTESELARLAAVLPQRQPNGEVSLDTAEATAVAVMPSTSVAHELDELLTALVAELPAEDALITRMRFWSDMSVADIARTLRLEQKPLYRRLDAIQARLRVALEARGIDRTRATEMLSDDVYS